MLPIFITLAFAAEPAPIALPDPVDPTLRASLAAAAFEADARGLPDPRGGEYREIDIVVRRMEPPGELSVHTTGFVLPGPEASKRVIVWNGLDYPVEHLGAPRSLEVDIAALLDGVEAEESYWAERTGGTRFRRWGSGDEEEALADESPTERVGVASPGRAERDGITWSFDPTDPRAGPPGWTDTLRVKDDIAFEVALGLLERDPAAPAFSYGWRRADRDEAIVAIGEYLKRGGTPR